VQRNPLILFFVGALVAVMLFAGIRIARNNRANPPKNGQLIGATAPDFELQTLDGSNLKLSSLRGKAVLLNFWATWCGPCRAIAPIVEELATEYQGKITIGKMDVDSNSATPMRYKVTGIPTLLVFKGGQVVEQIVGYKPKDAIAQALNRHIG